MQLRNAFFGLLFTFGFGIAQGAELQDTTGLSINLKALATSADVIILAQVLDTDYLYRRGFPVEGSAYLRVLITYKSDGLPDIIEVYEVGLHEHECYFPNPSVLEEGRRYLLFLKRDEQQPERYRGLNEGCALDVLVASDNSYAIRIPVTGINLTDSLSDLATPMTFSDPNASESNETISQKTRESYLEEGWLIAREDDYVYTHGLALSEFRQLVGGQN